MKIVQTPVRFYPYIGGVENYVLSLSKQLVKMGHEVKVICANETGKPESKVTNRTDGIEVERLNYVGKVANTNVTPTLPFKLLKENFDLIHTHLPTPWSADWSAFISKLKHTPLILTYHNDITASGMWKMFSWSYNKFLLNYLISQSSRILVSQSRFRRNKYLLKFKEKIIILPPGVDTEKFKPLKMEKWDKTILFVGSMDKFHDYKGLDDLIRAIKFLKSTGEKVKLLIVGTGDRQYYYSKLVFELGIQDQVEFIGNVDLNELIKLYSRCAGLVLPSKSKEQEGFGLVALEALSCGTPVIVSNIVGVARDVVKNKCGIVIVPEPKKIAIAIMNLLSESSSMGRKARKLVLSKYSWDIIAKKIEKIYNEVLGEYENSYSI